MRRARLTSTSCAWTSTASMPSASAPHGSACWRATRSCAAASWPTVPRRCNGWRAAPRCRGWCKTCVRAPMCQVHWRGWPHRSVRAASTSRARRSCASRWPARRRSAITSCGPTTICCSTVGAWRSCWPRCCAATRGRPASPRRGVSEITSRGSQRATRRPARRTGAACWPAWKNRRAWRPCWCRRWHRVPARPASGWPSTPKPRAACARPRAPRTSRSTPSCRPPGRCCWASARAPAPSCSAPPSPAAAPRCRVPSACWACSSTRCPWSRACGPASPWANGCANCRRRRSRRANTSTRRCTRSRPGPGWAGRGCSTRWWCSRTTRSMRPCVAMLRPA
ncbi:hypothetical protein D3C72_1381870 [compost metagenome]